MKYKAKAKKHRNSPLKIISANNEIRGAPSFFCGWRDHAGLADGSSVKRFTSHTAQSGVQTTGTGGSPQTSCHWVSLPWEVPAPPQIPHQHCLPLARMTGAEEIAEVNFSKKRSFVGGMV